MIRTIARPVGLPLLLAAVLAGCDPSTSPEPSVRLTVLNAPVAAGTEVTVGIENVSRRTWYLFADPCLSVFQRLLGGIWETAYEPIFCLAARAAADDGPAPRLVLAPVEVGPDESVELGFLLPEHASAEMHRIRLAVSRNPLGGAVVYVTSAPFEVVHGGVTVR